MTIGTKDLATTELDSFDEGRLTDELRKAKEELFNLRFQSATGTLEGHGRLRAVKRDIARIYTVLRERELGIRAIPAPAEIVAPEPKKARTRKAAAPAEVTPVTDEAPAVAEVSADEAPKKKAPAKKTAAATAASNADVSSTDVSTEETK